MRLYLDILNVDHNTCQKDSTPSRPSRSIYALPMASAELSRGVENVVGLSIVGSRDASGA